MIEHTTKEAVFMLQKKLGWRDFEWENQTSQSALFNKEQQPYPSTMTGSLITPLTLKLRLKKCGMFVIPLMEEYKNGQSTLSRSERIRSISKNGKL
jgi:hypothetical protein